MRKTISEHAKDLRHLAQSKALRETTVSRAVKKADARARADLVFAMTRSLGTCATRVTLQKSAETTLVSPNARDESRGPAAGFSGGSSSRLVRGRVAAPPRGRHVEDSVKTGRRGRPPPRAGASDGAQVLSRGHGRGPRGTEDHVGPEAPFPQLRHSQDGRGRSVRPRGRLVRTGAVPGRRRRRPVVEGARRGRSRRARVVPRVQQDPRRLGRRVDRRDPGVGPPPARPLREEGQGLRGALRGHAGQVRRAGRLRRRSRTFRPRRNLVRRS